MSIAAVMYERGFRIDDLMAAVVRRLRQDGLHLCGLVQENPDGASGCASMILVDVASRTRFGISQALGSCAHGCRLDPHGLVDAGARLEQALDANADLLVLNKFGKAETEEGRGLRGALVRAVELEVPVLTAVRPPYDIAWADFHGGCAAALPPEIDAIVDWCVAATAARRAEAAEVVS
ncbi:DUF2478 domain-containing protein [Xanthobacteraceae bacterium Astr-EGSB]|uniref:DUF2478 domain-containing protein n=1 Tax=Astrobacterium formosum TaxID=3069710 RepID=UPI0027B22579|nr:DUF2478 domain-containing protein [Xanthobacteraceae bacterium Astr-EGSB]